MSFRFLHTADLHLDAGFTGYPEEAARLREAQKASFTAAVDAALENRVHAFLMAGDLLNGEILPGTMDFLWKELGRLRRGGIMVFYAHGNHDPSNMAVSLPSYVEVFDSRYARMVEVRDRSGAAIGAVVGAGFAASREYDSLLSSFPRRHGSIPMVGLLHTQLTEEAGRGTPYAPCSLNDLEALDYDYWALGHIHRRQSYGPRIGYSGCLCGTGYGDPGAHGALLVEATAHSDPSIRFLPLAGVEWQEAAVTGLAACSNEDALFEAARRTVDGLRLSAPAMLQLTLRGEVGCFDLLTSPTADMVLTRLGQRLKEAFGALRVDVEARDLARPVEPEALKEEMTLLGEMLSLLSAARTEDAVLDRILDAAKPLGLGGCRRTSKEEQRAYARTLLCGSDKRIIQLMREEEDSHEVD